MKDSLAVKKNLSSMQVLKTLQLLMEDNYTMAELVEKLNANEKEPIFNNSVVSKYINTCRYLGIDIQKIHNKYFVASIPFGLDLTVEEQDLLNNLSKTAEEKLSRRLNKSFIEFFTKVSKYSNKQIMRIEPGKENTFHNIFETAVSQKRNIRLMFRTRIIIECIPVDIVLHKGKEYFKVIYEGSERLIACDRISGLEVLNREFVPKNFEENIIFKVSGDLYSRYKTRENEELVDNVPPDYMTICNKGESREKMIPRLLRYGYFCEVEKPLDFREEMKKTINAMLANYGE